MTTPDGYIRSPCPDDDTCTCGCHHALLGDPRPEWETCCGHPLTWGLVWPASPTGLDDWPTCWCGSGLLVTSFQSAEAEPLAILYNASCCMGWSRRSTRPKTIKDGPLECLGGGWNEAVEHVGGYPMIHAVNRGEARPEPARPEVRLTDELAQPALF